MFIWVIYNTFSGDVLNLFTDELDCIEFYHLNYSSDDIDCPSIYDYRAVNVLFLIEDFLKSL